MCVRVCVCCMCLSHRRDGERLFLDAHTFAIHRQFECYRLTLKPDGREYVRVRADAHTRWNQKAKDEIHHRERANKKKTSEKPKPRLHNMNEKMMSKLERAPRRTSWNSTCRGGGGIKTKSAPRRSSCGKRSFSCRPSSSQHPPLAKL